MHAGLMSQGTCLKDAVIAPQVHLSPRVIVSADAISQTHIA